MALINKTIYPKLKKVLTQEELSKFFTPTEDETTFAKSEVKGDLNVFSFLIYLKTFQALNYFPMVDEIPISLIRHMKEILHIRKKIKPEFKERSITRYKKSIRNYLNIISDRDIILELTNDAVSEYEPTLENIEDVFNAVLEKLIKNNCELPAFSVLERSIKSKQNEINNRIFKTVSDNLSKENKDLIDNILKSTDNYFTRFNYIKERPKSPSLNHLKELKENYLYLKSINIGQGIINLIPPAKINKFTTLAKSLDASEIKRISDDKRYTIMICFIYKSYVKTGDDLITMFVKRIGKMHTKAKDDMKNTLENQRSKTENAVNILHKILITSQDLKGSNFEDNIKSIIEKSGGYSNLLSDCEVLTAYHNNNYYPLLPKRFKSHRKTLFEIVKILPIRSSSKDSSLMEAINYLISCENKKSDFIDANVDLSFVSEKWRKFVVTQNNKTDVFIRKHFEMCIFSYISSEFKTGDLCVEFSEEYADYRKQLLSWNECRLMLNDYCNEMGLQNNPKDFIEQLKNKLDSKAKEVDKNYPENSEIVIGTDGEVVLKKSKSIRNLPKIKEFKRTFETKMPERNIVESICKVEKLLNFSKHFGPLSDSEPKFSDAPSRYVLLVFGYGSNLGPTQTSKHVKESITPHMIQFTNQRHVTSEKLDKAIVDIVNEYNKLPLPQVWGDVNTVSADGTKLDLYDENLLSEYHIRYGGYGGIAYNHVSDRYIALFSHFIPCGVWEAVYIIDGLLKNKSDIQPDTVHADTQGQSVTVFALTHLLGIKLMPRIRNWKDLKFYKPYKESRYNHIDSLFKDTVNWDIIETHFEDLFQIVLSIKSGKILPSTLLRKLNNYSKKNKLFQAFKELGNVIRTVYLLDFISNIELREKITESTNKTEAYNAFMKWILFGGDGVIRENDLDEQTKIIKYNELLANILIFQNTVDMMNAIKSLRDDGIEVSKDDIKNLSPYLTSHIKRFGEYIIDLDSETKPEINFEFDKFLK